MKPWMIVLLGGVVVAGLFKLTETPIPEGVVPSLRNKDIVACTSLQSKLKILKSVVELDDSNLADKVIEPEFFKSAGREVLTTSVIQMSPRVKAAYSLVSDELLSYPNENLSYQEANSLFSKSLEDLDPALVSACSHVQD